MCANGTVLDPGTNSCVIDPNSCQAGTVLINNKCVDPTAGLAIDVEESAEPNAMAVLGIEDSQNPAGVLTLKAAGTPLVVKGTVNPFRDEDGNDEIDPDMDTYIFEVNAPALIEVSVDGVNGLMGAFVGVTGVVELGAWIRYGMNVTGDTSKRQLYLPAAGLYALVVTDTRSMFIDGGSPPAAGQGGAAGGADATYFMSVTVLPTPSPTPLTIANDAATHEGTLAVGEVKFFSLPRMGLGFNNVVVDMPTTANGSVILGRNGAFRGLGDETNDIFGSVPATVSALGYRAQDTGLIVVDTTFHYGPQPAPFTLTASLGTAGQLSRAGESVTQPKSDDFTAFFYDVETAGETDGFALTWSEPISGVLVDEDLFIIARFTFGANGFTQRRFSGYTGLIRHPSGGRYYFLTADLLGTEPTEITATSTIAVQTVGNIVKGTPLTNVAINQFQSNAFLYNAGAVADAWQVFNATGTDTGNITNSFYRLGQAFGRLDTLTTVGTGTIVEDAVPVFTQTYPAAGSPQGRVLIDDATATYFVTTNTATVTGTPTFSLDFKRRDHEDLGTIATGATVTRADQVIGPAATTKAYLLRTTAGNRVRLVSDPDADSLDTRMQLLNRDETVRTTFNPAIVGQSDLAEFMQAAEGWTAVVVSSPTAVATDVTFDFSAASFGPTTYARAATATAFDDACAGGTVQTMTAVPPTDPANDEGLSQNAISAPANFSYFGFAAPQITVSTNGWLSFGAVTAPAFANQNMPAVALPNAVVAPYWDDLENVVVCTKTTGTKLVVQWTGNLFAAPKPAVAFQAILDGANSTIEFVWGTAHAANGASATVGIEDPIGNAANKVGFNQANTTPPGTSLKFTPN